MGARGQLDSHHLLSDIETHSKTWPLTCPFVRGLYLSPAPGYLCALQFLLPQNTVSVASFPRPGLSLGPRGLCGSLEQFLQPLEMRVAAVPTHVWFRPSSKSNGLIKKAWPQDSAVFWQQAGREKMVIQLIITQICSCIADWSGRGKQTSLWHQFLS